MVEGGFFVDSIKFLDKIGFYDVVLPFLLVFTIVYAILEKTKIFGTEGKDNGSKKNLNAMAAFVIAFLVVASSSLVATISTFVANSVMILVLCILFLLLVGSFNNMSDEKFKDGFFLEGKWKWTFVAVVFIGVVLVFLDAATTEDADICYNETPCTWLEVAFDFIAEEGDKSALGSIVLLGLIALFIGYISKGENTEETS